jgi:uncharacterized membrane protein YdjX (TVP38/TMEM64 family)
MGMKMLQKIKDFFNKNKKKILEGVALVAILIAFSFLCLLLLSAFGIVYFDGGDLQFNVELFDRFKNSWYGWVIIIVIQAVITNLLCFVPGVSMACIMLVQVLCDDPWQAFLISFISVMASSFTMYYIGRFGGYKVCKKLLGEEDCEKASELLNHKGAVYFPLMMMFPIFPDEALIMISGTLKMTMKWFAPSVIVGRGIGIASIVFGMSVIPFERFTSLWHWAGFIAVCAIGIVGIFYLAYKFNAFLERRNQRIKEEESKTNTKEE